MGFAVNRKNPNLGDAAKPLYEFSEGFFVASIVGLPSLLRRGELPVEALRVLGWLLENVKRSNRVEATQAVIGQALGMTQSNVSRAFRRLEAARLLLRVKEPHGMSFWYLDSRSTFRGSAEAHSRSLERQRRQRERARKSNVVALPSSSSGSSTAP